MGMRLPHPASSSFQIRRTVLIVQQDPQHILIRFRRPRQVLSSSILNGGLVEAHQILNLKVPQNFHGRRSDFEPPAQTLQTYADVLDLKGHTVGMMTAASMQSFRMKQSTCEDIAVSAVVTSGLANAKRIGEPAEWRYVDENLPKPGTINVITVIDAALTPAAMVEAVMMATEAKSACLQALGIQGPRSGQPATGTGTDAVAVAGNPAGRRVIYCGKHVLLGEILGRVVMGALQSSLSGWVPVESGAGPTAMDLPARKVDA